MRDILGQHPPIRLKPQPTHRKPPEGVSSGCPTLLRNANSVYLDLGADQQIHHPFVLHASLNHKTFSNGDPFG